MPKPKLPDDIRLSEIIKFRVSKSEKEAIRKAAAFYQYDEITEFVRESIMKQVKAAESGSVEQSISALSATAENLAQQLGVDAEFKPVFKTYKVVDEIAEL